MIAGAPQLRQGPAPVPFQFAAHRGPNGVRRILEQLDQCADPATRDLASIARLSGRARSRAGFAGGRQCRAPEVRGAGHRGHEFGFGIGGTQGVARSRGGSGFKQSSGFQVLAVATPSIIGHGSACANPEMCAGAVEGSESGRTPRNFTAALEITRACSGASPGLSAAVMRARSAALRGLSPEGLTGGTKGPGRFALRTSRGVPILVRPKLRPRAGKGRPGSTENPAPRPDSRCPPLFYRPARAW